MTSAPTAIVFRTGQLGDTIVSLPAISAIRHALPNHRLVLVTDAHAQPSGFVSSWDVLKGTGWFDGVMFYDPELPAWNKAWNRLSVVMQLRRLRPEYAFNLAPARNSWQAMRDHAMFRYLIGVERYYSEKNREGARARGRFMPRSKPEWLRLLRIADPDLGAVLDEGFRLQVPEQAHGNALAILDSLGVPRDGRLLAVGPGSKMRAKRWPPERFRDVGRKLLEAFPDLFLLILGGNDERHYCDALVSAWGPRSANCAGMAPVPESAAILGRCHAYLGNDTGTMHLAAAVGIPCIAVFSARDYPGRWEPMGTGHVILRHETDCGGCMLEDCVTHGNCCLLGISVDMVFKAAEGVLGSSARSAPAA